MTASPKFDTAAAHVYFSAHCFNSAWDLIDKAQRTPEENRMMVALNQASIYHWASRPDCTNENLSVGYWQASRIQALLGNAAEAARHAEMCLELSEGLEPFYVGYAYEALARAAALGGDRERATGFASLARRQADLVEEEEHRTLLVRDLATLDSPSED